MLEETGLVITAVEQVIQTEDDFPEVQKYYNTYFVYCEMSDVDAQPEVSLLTFLPQPLPLFDRDVAYYPIQHNTYILNDKDRRLLTPAV